MYFRNLCSTRTQISWNIIEWTKLVFQLPGHFKSCRKFSSQNDLTTEMYVWTNKISWDVTLRWFLSGFTILQQSFFYNWLHWKLSFRQRFVQCKWWWKFNQDHKICISAIARSPPMYLIKDKKTMLFCSTFHEIYPWLHCVLLCCGCIISFWLFMLPVYKYASA